MPLDGNKDVAIIDCVAPGELHTGTGIFLQLYTFLKKILKSQDIDIADWPKALHVKGTRFWSEFTGNEV